MLISGGDSEKLQPPRDPSLGVGLDPPISGNAFLYKRTQQHSHDGVHGILLILFVV